MYLIYTFAKLITIENFKKNIKIPEVLHGIFIALPPKNIS
jgi:hypothetical protein